MNRLSKALHHLALSLPDGPAWRTRRALIQEASQQVNGLVKPVDDDVKEFHLKFGHPVASVPTMPGSGVMNFRVRLIREECDELIEAIDSRDLRRVAQESVDLIYVVVGTLVVCGIRLAPFWDLIHSANMQKVVDPNGGKPLKPEGWEKPDCGSILDSWSDEEPRLDSPMKP